MHPAIRVTAVMGILAVIAAGIVGAAYMGGQFLQREAFKKEIKRVCEDGPGVIFCDVKIHRLPNGDWGVKFAVKGIHMGPETQSVGDYLREKLQVGE